MKYFAYHNRFDTNPKDPSPADLIAISKYKNIYIYRVKEKYEDQFLKKYSLNKAVGVRVLFEVSLREALLIAPSRRDFINVTKAKYFKE